VRRAQHIGLLPGVMAPKFRRTARGGPRSGNPGLYRRRHESAAHTSICCPSCFSTTVSPVRGLY
jgi:hypothetical protein